MRLKHRFVICQPLDDITSFPMDNEQKYTARDLQICIRDKIETLFGDIGVGSYGAMTLIKAFDLNSRIFVVRTSRDAEKYVRLAISCITSIKNRNLIIRTLNVAGSTRTCTDKLRCLFRVYVEHNCKSDTEKQERHQYYSNVLSNLDL